MFLKFRKATENSVLTWKHCCDYSPIWATSHQSTTPLILWPSPTSPPPLTACFNATESRPVRSHPTRGAAGEQPLHLGAKLLVQKLENSPEVWGKLKSLTLKILELWFIFTFLSWFQKQLTANFVALIFKNNILFLSFPLFICRTRPFVRDTCGGSEPQTCGFVHFCFLPSVLVFPQLMSCWLFTPHIKWPK